MLRRVAHNVTPFKSQLLFQETATIDQSMYQSAMYQSAMYQSAIAGDEPPVREAIESMHLEVSHDLNWVALLAQS